MNDARRSIGSRLPSLRIGAPTSGDVLYGVQTPNDGGSQRVGLGQLTSPEAVLRAADEHDALGGEAFLAKYGYGPSRVYLLQLNGKSYDSKAIAGVAHGIEHPSLGPLMASQFSGGAAGAARRLERLGFSIVTPAQARPPAVGDEYATRTEIYDAYYGDRVGGIVRFPGEAIVNVFSDEDGPYADDAPTATEPFEYRGEGRRGDQRLLGGNAQLDHARETRSAIRYWYRPSGGRFTFVGWAAVLDRTLVWGRDDDARMRTEFAFQLRLVPSDDVAEWPSGVLAVSNTAPVPSTAPPGPPDHDDGVRSRARIYRELLAQIGEMPTPGPVGRREHHGSAFARSARAREAVLLRARNTCENPGCNGMAPDVTARGEAILEVDHVEDLALGGADHPSSMLALCPNCHAARTRGRNRKRMTGHLRRVALRLHRTALAGGRVET